MVENFDPYHKWLGIPPTDQPANPTWYGAENVPASNPRA